MLFVGSEVSALLEATLVVVPTIGQIVVSGSLSWIRKLLSENAEVAAARGRSSLTKMLKKTMAGFSPTVLI